MELEAYCDAAYASYPLTRRSITAYFICLGGAPISWKTKKQNTVSLSSTEAEYRALAFATCEVKWLKGLLHSLGVTLNGPVRLFYDNESAIQLSNNPVHTERTKHIKVDIHFFSDA